MVLNYLNAQKLLHGIAPIQFILVRLWYAGYGYGYGTEVGV